MQMQHRSEFFGLCFSYSFMDFCSDTKRSKLCVFSACQSSLSLERAVHYGSLSVHPAATVNSGIPLLGASSFSLVWLVDLLLQRNIPMKSAKNAMRLMWWPPSETGEEDQCCGQSQVPGLCPAVCLSELPWWTPILSSVCLGKVFFFFILREEGRGGERKEGRRGKKKAREKGQEREGSLERAEEKRQKKEKMEGDIDCSQAEGALCGAWWWALRTPGLSLLSGPASEAYGPSRGCGGIGAGTSGSCEQPGSVF